MGKNDTCLIKMEAIDAWKRAAEENGLKYEAVLEAVGMSNRSIGPARASYAILSKSKGLDPNQDIGVIGITTFQTACRMFGVNADDYIVDIETLKKAKPMTGDEEIWMMQKSEHNLTDVVLCAESISNKLEITNQLLREIRGAIENAPDRTKDVVSKLDKMAGACNEIKSNTTHLIDIKKDVNFNRKSTASIDQRLNGINQIFASQKIAVDRIKSMVERFVSGK